MVYALMIIYRKFFPAISLFLLACSPAWSIQAAQYQQLDGLFKQVISKSSYTEDDLKKLFEQVEIQPRIIEIMDRPAESMPWHRYRKIFLNEKNISSGAKFWKAHADILARAEDKFGVPPEIIVATLGVETRYGTHTGNYRVIDALSTLALEYPRRSKFFSRELVNFLILTDEQGLQPLAVTGSYAGAIGLPQYMPSSYRAYAIDFSNDGSSDLVNSIEDAIGSIASYYREHGWNTGQPISHPATSVSEKASKLVVKKRKTDRSLGELLEQGVTLDTEADQSSRVGLIKLSGEQSPEYHVAFDNFFVITRYNTSRLYAMAVQLLGEQIKSRVLETP